MDQEKLTALTDEQLEAQNKKLKSNKIISATLIGFLVGVAAYSTYMKGFTFWTVFPLFFVFILVANNKKAKALSKKLESRQGKENVE